MNVSSMNVYYVQIGRGTTRLLSLSVVKIQDDPYGRYQVLEANHGYPVGYLLNLGSWCESKDKAIKNALRIATKDYNDYMDAVAIRHKTIRDLKTL